MEGNQPQLRAKTSWGQGSIYIYKIFLIHILKLPQQVWMLSAIDIIITQILKSTFLLRQVRHYFFPTNNIYVKVSFVLFVIFFF